MALLRRAGPAVLDWQRRHGLADAKARCIALVIAGLVPFVGWLALGWTPGAMLLFLAVDVLAVIAGDALKLLLAADVVRSSHERDHQAQELLGIVGGLEDGTGTYVEYSKTTSPLLLFGIACGGGVFLLAILAVSFEALGSGSLSRALDAPWFVWIAAASVALHLGQAAVAAARVRGRTEAPAVLFLDAGGVIGLLAGLMFLMWLPMLFQAKGVIMLLVALFAFRLAFGLFALYWIPRVTRALERRLAEA